MTTVNEAAPTAQLKLVEKKPEPEVIIREAKTDQDVVAIHRFLLVVAAPYAVDGINVVKSLQEVIRVTVEGAALMAMIGDTLVGSLGLMKVVWWHNDTAFLTDRWDFTLPEYWNGPVHKALLEEAKAIAKEAEMRFVHNGKLRDGKGGVARFQRHLYSPEPIEKEEA